MKYLSIKAAVLLTLAAFPFALSSLANAQEPGLEEITVTAQKRSQSAQDVGISIVAMGSDELENNRILDASGVTEFVPNMELARTPDNDVPIFVIRGVALQDYNTNNTPTTALVVDDVYQPYGIYGAFSLFDAERVEVLKGPQGGLYGRNSTGGAINIVAKRPSFDGTEANIAVDAGNYGTADLRAGLSIPFSDTFAARIAAQYDSSDGYYYNTHLDREQGGKDKLQSRVTLSFVPSDTFSADLRLTMGRDRSEVGIPEIEGILSPDPADRNPRPYADFGLDMNVPLNDNGTGRLCDAVLTTGIPDATCINANGFATDGDPYSGADAVVRKNRDDFDAASLNLQFEFPGVTIVSVTSAASMDFFHTNGSGSVGVAEWQNGSDWEALSVLLGRTSGSSIDDNYVTDYQSDIKSWSQELRILSSGDDRFSWMIGSVFAKDELDENRYCRFPANLYFDYIGFPGCGTMLYTQGTQAWSGYGQLAFDLSDTLRLTIDARYTDETKDYSGQVWLNDGAYVCGFYVPDLETCAELLGYDPDTNLFPLTPGSTADYDKSEPSYKVNLDYMPTDNVLVYLSAGQSFKSGGFFGGFFFDPSSILAYEPEKNFAVELGVKSTLLGGAMRLNAAVFDYDYTDYQGPLNATGEGAAGATFSGISNLGDVDVRGLEADLQWLATDGLTLGLGIGLLDTEITKVSTLGFDNPNVVIGVNDITQETVPILGNELNAAPKLSGNARVRYDFDLSGTLSASLQADASWSDDYYLSVANDPYSREKGVTLVNARAQILGGTDARWNVAIWGRNLTDEAYRTSTNFDGIWSNYSNWNAPRTYGVTFGYTF